MHYAQSLGFLKQALASQVLDAYVKDFQQRNPNFYVFNAVKHMDEKTPHIHLNYIPVATGYKRGMAVQNGHAKALEQMGYGNSKQSIDNWRKDEREIIRNLCQEYGIILAQETKGRGKTYTPDMYKKAMDQARAEASQDPDMIDLLKAEVKADMTEELATLEQQITEKEATKAKRNDILKKMTSKRDSLQTDIAKLEKDRATLKTTLTKYTPKADDMERVVRIQGTDDTQGTVKKNLLGDKVSMPLGDYNFLMKIAKQNAHISEATMEALKDKSELMDKLAETQLLYLTVAAAFRSIDHYGDRNKLKYRVQKVLEKVVDSRVVSWLVEDMGRGRPSKLDELEREQGELIKKAYADAQSFFKPRISNSPQRNHTLRTNTKIYNNEPEL